MTNCETDIGAFVDELLERGDHQWSHLRALGLTPWEIRKLWHAALSWAAVLGIPEADARPWAEALLERVVELRLTNLEATEQ